MLSTNHNRRASRALVPAFGLRNYGGLKRNGREAGQFTDGIPRHAESLVLRLGI
jgi:hypothetical protein